MKSAALELLTLVIRHPLNRSRPAALARVVSWQLTSRLSSRARTVRFVNDTRLYLERGMTGATGNWYCGLHEAGEMAFVLHALRRGELFADIGANVGSYTVLAGATGANVVSAEPISGTFARLRANIELNQMDVRAVNCGLSACPGVLPFVTSLGCGNRVMKMGDTLTTALVPVTTLDALLPNAPAVLKIDVEGHEPHVLAGGRRTLTDRRLRAVVMETFESQDAELRAAMSSFGFAPYAYDPLARALAPLGALALNAIFVRDAAEMQARCQAAPTFRLVNGHV